MSTPQQNTPRIMLDLKTLGTTPGCAILSIGATEFIPETNSLGLHFYCVISIDSCLSYGLSVSLETLDWWEKQSEEARQVLHEAKTEGLHETLSGALYLFNAWLKQFPTPPEIWGNGSDFDNSVLQYAYKATGITPAWPYFKNRCFRTLCSLYPSLKMERSGTHHNALNIARSQALHANLLLNIQSKEEALNAQCTELLNQLNDPKIAAKKETERMGELTAILLFAEKIIKDCLRDEYLFLKPLNHMSLLQLSTDISKCVQKDPTVKALTTKQM